MELCPKTSIFSFFSDFLCFFTFFSLIYTGGYGILKSAFTNTICVQGRRTQDIERSTYCPAGVICREIIVETKILQGV
jgi:hypothetical protein